MYMLVWSERRVCDERRGVLSSRERESTCVSLASLTLNRHWSSCSSASPPPTAYMQRQSKTKSAADSTVSSEAAVSFTASDETTPSPQLNAQAKQPTSAKVTPTSAGGEPALRKTEEHTVTATGTNSTERLALAHRSSTASATSAHATPEATITRPVATKPAVVTAKVASRPAVLHKTAQPTSRGGSARVRRASLSIALDKHGVRTVLAVYYTVRHCVLPAIRRLLITITKLFALCCTVSHLWFISYLSLNLL